MEMTFWVKRRILCECHPLYDEFFQKSDRTTFQHSCPWSLPLSFLVIGQIGCRNIRIFVTGRPYTELSAMHVDMPVEPSDAFSKEFHVRRKTHMTFMTCGIGYTYVKVLKISLPVWDKNILKGANAKKGWNFITDSTDYLVGGYRVGGIYHDTSEQLIVYVFVKMFYQQSVELLGSFYGST